MLDISTLKASIEMAYKIIHKFEWLLDLYVLDFFVDDHWNQLPDCWRNSFNNIEPQDFGKLVSGISTTTVPPLSFIALISAIKTLSISRQPMKKHNKENKDNSNPYTTHPKLKNMFLKHVKLKKRHEISLMSEMVSKVAYETKCDEVIDFGSGLGHLVRVLSYRGNLSVSGIESQQQLVEEARKLDVELEYTASKYLLESTMPKLRRPKYLNVTLTSEDQLQLLLPNEFYQYGLVGLHPCGDLGPLLLKHFVRCGKVKFICLVGCCYMKLSCEGDHVGYPLSQHVKSFYNRLSYPCREIACHSIEIYCERLMTGKYEDLKIHAFRAALEKILVEHDPKLKHAQVKSIKHTHNMNFKEYCSLATERLSFPIDWSTINWSEAENYVEQWRHIVILYTLRLAIAPLVETIILLDRLLYIREKGLSCEIMPVFDPWISPRNHIMIARR